MALYFHLDIWPRISKLFLLGTSCGIRSGRPNSATFSYLSQSPAPFLHHLSLFLCATTHVDPTWGLFSRQISHRRWSFPFLSASNCSILNRACNLYTELSCLWVDSDHPKVHLSPPQMTWVLLGKSAPSSLGHGSCLLWLDRLTIFHFWLLPSSLKQEVDR